jgi:hypothetical protein
MVLETLQRQGLRASLGPGSQTLSRAIVDAHDAGVPFLAIVGKREGPCRLRRLGDRFVQPPSTGLSDTVEGVMEPAVHPHVGGETVTCTGTVTG